MEPFLGQILTIGFNFAPRGWSLCDGQILSINQNQSLYSLLGTTFGGDGRTSFALPDLRGRTAVHPGTEPFSGVTVVWGEKSGQETVTLTTNELPAHTHTLRATTDNGNTFEPAGAVYANTTSGAVVDHEYIQAAPNVSMKSDAITSTGGGQSINVLNPFLGVNMVIALQGLFPPRN